MGLVLLWVPMLTVTAGPVASLAVALWLAWRTGRRWPLITMIWWWLMAMIVFLLPDLHLSRQGYAVDL
jgi:hypothetical protein